MRTSLFHLFEQGFGSTKRRFDGHLVSPSVLREETLSQTRRSDFGSSRVREVAKIAFEFQRGGMSRTFTASHWRVENVRLLEAAVREGKLPRDRFDRALLVTVLGEIPDRERALPRFSTP
jgi:hypothetical protein